MDIDLPKHILTPIKLSIECDLLIVECVILIIDCVLLAIE
jgi:hypothetical protein